MIFGGCGRCRKELLSFYVKTGMMKKRFDRMRDEVDFFRSLDLVSSIDVTFENYNDYQLARRMYEERDSALSWKFKLPTIRQMIIDGLPSSETSSTPTSADPAPFSSRPTSADPAPFSSFSSYQPFDTTVEVDSSSLMNEQPFELDIQLHEAMSSRAVDRVQEKFDGRSWKELDADVMAYYRLGYLKPRHEDLRDLPEKDHLQVSRGLMMNTSSVRVEAWHSSFFDYISGLMDVEKKKCSPQEFASSFSMRHLCDLTPSSPSCILDKRSFKSLRRVKDHDTAILVAPHRSQGWTLIVFSPVDALHACRLLEEDKSVDDVVRQFVKNGVKFRTAIPVREPVPPGSITPVTMKALGSTLDGKDLETVLKVRDAVVRSPAVVRAAYMEGGVVWRIMLDIMGPANEELIMQGPRRNDGADGGMIGSSWWDNQLDQGQLAALCLLFYTANGERSCPSLSTHLLFPSFVFL